MKPLDGHSIDVVRIRQCYYDYDFLSTSRDVWVDRLPKMFFFFFFFRVNWLLPATSLLVTFDFKFKTAFPWLASAKPLDFFV